MTIDTLNKPFIGQSIDTKLLGSIKKKLYYFSAII